MTAHSITIVINFPTMFAAPFNITFICHQCQNDIYEKHKRVGRTNDICS